MSPIRHVQGPRRRGLASTLALIMGVLALLLVPATPGAAATQFSDGFESGTLSAWSTVSGFSVQSNPTSAYAGSWYGLASSSGGSAYAQATLPSSLSEAYVQTAVKVVSAPGGAPTLLRLLTGSGSAIVSLKTDSSGRLILKNNAVSGTRTSATTLSSGTWHVVQLHAFVNGTVSLVEVWLDGTQVSDLTWATSLGTTGTGRIQLAHKGSSSGFQLAFDEVLVDTAFIGGGPPTPPATPCTGSELAASRSNMPVETYRMFVSCGLIQT